MRLGLRPTIFGADTDSSTIRQLYGGKPEVWERHRHRYEVNPAMVERLEKGDGKTKGGLRFIGKDERGERMQILEVASKFSLFVSTSHRSFVFDLGLYACIQWPVSCCPWQILTEPFPHLTLLSPLVPFSPSSAIIRPPLLCRSPSPPRILLSTSQPLSSFPRFHRRRVLARGARCSGRAQLARVQGSSPGECYGTSTTEAGRRGDHPGDPGDCQPG